MTGTRKLSALLLALSSLLVPFSSAAAKSIEVPVVYYKLPNGYVTTQLTHSFWSCLMLSPFLISPAQFNYRDPTRSDVERHAICAALFLHV